VGPYAELQARHRPDEVLGSGEHVVVPGFVNAHHHVGLTPLQLGSPDHPLELWFASRMTARDVDPYLDTLYSAFEMLESGITTVQHLHGLRTGPAARVGIPISRLFSRTVEREMPSCCATLESGSLPMSRRDRSVQSNSRLRLGSDGGIPRLLLLDITVCG